LLLEKPLFYRGLQGVEWSVEWSGVEWSVEWSGVEWSEEL